MRLPEEATDSSLMFLFASVSLLLHLTAPLNNYILIMIITTDPTMQQF